MQMLEDAVNGLSDKDSGWWPFLFLRPEPTTKMTSARVLVLAVLYGLPAGLLANIVMKVSHERPELHALVFPALVVLGFFAFYRATFAWCWNRRAARMSVTSERAARFRAAFEDDDELRREED